MIARSGEAYCPICNLQRLLVEHHINGRDIPEKNRKWNRCWICASCHDDAHAGRIVIENWASTSGGKKLIWRSPSQSKITINGAMTKLYGDKSAVDIPTF